MVSMTSPTPQPRVPAGAPASTGGQFTNKTHADSEVELGAPNQAYDAFGKMLDATYRLRQIADEYTYDALDAYCAETGVARIVFDWGDNSLYAVGYYDADGNELDETELPDSTSPFDVNELVSGFDDWESTRSMSRLDYDSDTTQFTYVAGQRDLVEPAPLVAQSFVWGMEHRLNDIDNLERIVQAEKLATARRAISGLVRNSFPDAAEIVMVDISETGSEPHWQAKQIRDVDGHAIWDTDGFYAADWAGDTPAPGSELNDHLVSFTPLLDIAARVGHTGEHGLEVDGDYLTMRL